MVFRIGQHVVYPGFGLGRVADVVHKSFSDAEPEAFYEVTGEHSTMWVPVGAAASRGLRPVTHATELPTYRSLLRSRPAALDPDARLRHRSVVESLKRGRLHDLCEVVRDLSAYGWHSPLNEYDLLALNKSRHWLLQEWAAAAGESPAEAQAEVDALLQAARSEYGGA